MAILGELAAELVGMFAGEKQLTLAVLALIAAAGLLVDFSGLDPLLGGAVLLLGCLTVLVESVIRGARPRTV
jgi:hypothetical protein